MAATALALLLLALPAAAGPWSHPAAAEAEPPAGEAGPAETAPEETGGEAASSSTGAPAGRPPPAPAPDEPAARFFATATVEERPVESAAAAVTVIDRETLDALGATNVGQALALVPGLSLASGGTRGGLTTAQLRGGDPNFTRVLIDGVPVNDATYQVGEVFNFEALPVDAIERIEVVRGPLSAFYGSSGLAGAIHVFTRRGLEGAARGEVEAAAGDAEHRRLHLALAGGAGGADSFLSLLREEEAGRVADERFELWQLLGRQGWSLGKRASLRLAGRLAAWEGDDYPEASGGPVFGSGELRRAENREASLGAELARTGRGGRLHKLTLAAYRHALDRESPAIPPRVPASAEETRFLRGRLGWTTSFEPRPGWRLGLGADVEREQGDNESLLSLPDFLGGPVRGDYSLSRTTPGAFAELLGERGPLGWELGLRLDLPEEAGEQVSPRLGLAWRLPGGATRLRASVGRAWKLPGFFALASPPALGGNPDLAPEVMTGGDVGVEHRFEAAGVETSLGLFVQRFRDLVDFDFETFSHVNRSRVKARGVEAALAWRPASPKLAAARFGLRANVTCQEVEDEATGRPLRHRPRWTGALLAGGRAASRLDLHLDLRFASGSADEQIPVPERRSVEGYALVGLAAAWHVDPRWRLRLRLDNLVDERYETMIGFPGPGRSGRIALARRWGQGREEAAP